MRRLGRHPEVLHHAEAGHRQPPLERAEGLSVLLEQLVEQAPAGRVGERPEHFVYGPSICDLLVTCKGCPQIGDRHRHRRRRRMIGLSVVTMSVCAS
jgi:hypothetical protein